MRLVPLAVCLALSGCSRGPAAPTTSSTTTAGGTSGAPVRIQTATVAFGVKPVSGDGAATEVSDVWLAVTDETGASRSYPLGDTTGTCTADPGGEMGALGTLRCAAGDDGTGTNFVVVARNGTFIVLRQTLDPSLDEPADYIELARIPYPAGAKLSFGS